PSSNPVNLVTLEEPAKPDAPQPPKPAPPPGPPPKTSHDVDLGPGFPAVSPARRRPLEVAHDWVAYKMPGPYGSVMDFVLDQMSGPVEKAAGVNIDDLIGVDRTLYQTLAPAKDDGDIPLFQAIAQGKGADGQGAYVYLGDQYASDADHLIRAFSNLPLDTLSKLPAPAPPLDAVWKTMLSQAQNQQFPVYISTEGKPGTQTATDIIASKSLASIAQRENSLGSDFPDPRDYYRWLVVRARSNHDMVDPWLSLKSPSVHENVETIKTELTPPWLTGQGQDPFGMSPDPKKSQDAYHRLIGLAGGGKPPTWQNMADYADAAISMDRDLMTGVQTYWVKMMRECSPEQRSSLLAPLAKAWVSLNLLRPGDQNFDLVSPDDAPMINLVNRGDAKTIQERYDRSMALGEVMEHTMDSLGIDERKQFMTLLTGEIKAREPDIQARENDLRQSLGSQYQGIDVDKVLTGEIDARDPALKGQLDVLQNAYGQGSYHPMTSDYAERLRHFGLLDWMANRQERYGDGIADLVGTSADFKQKPLIVSEFYTPPPASGSQALVDKAPGPSQEQVFGQAVPGQDPLKMSVVLEGGGGKGFAYPECLQKVAQALNNQKGQVAIDEYCGTSAGAITAGILACGFNFDEMPAVMEKTNFTNAYSDYMWLEGGVDPKVRGVDRNGLFSMQGMYKQLYGLFSEKLGITDGRPILFRDMPFKLKVRSTVLNDNLPADLKKQFDVQPDGSVEFSNEKTPNMDVISAICASAAVPGFFNSPQIRIAQPTDDPKNPDIYRMQLMDGGSVDNWPIASASPAPDGKKSMLVALPAWYSTPTNPPVELSTLDFSSDNVGPINANNDKQYDGFAPQVASLMQAARGEGVGRVVLGMHLSLATDQTGPIVQGHTAADTDQFLKLADSVKLPHLSAADARTAVNTAFKAKKPMLLEQVAVNEVLGTNGVFKPGIHGNPQYNPPTEEAHNMIDVMTGTVSAVLTAPSQLQAKLFEQA
ncbi:MAG TPA: patatin-like phospholipase family protein, partial [Candidatus Xenobia bacterium]